MQLAEAALKLLAVHIGASACAEPRGRAEIHIVDDEAMATGVRIQDVCLCNDRFLMSSGWLSTPQEKLGLLGITYVLRSREPAQGSPAQGSGSSFR